MAIRVLLVDDEPSVVRVNARQLELDGFTCLSAERGRQALAILAREAIDVVVLDIGLPDMDGLEVCRAIRQDPKHRGLPILFLSARQDEIDRVLGLEIGADDYLVKPASPRELAARVKAILRRTQPERPPASRCVGALTINEATREASVNGTPVFLTATEFELLTTLVAGAGRVWRRTELLQRVWGSDEAAELVTRRVDVHMRRLREKLGPEARRIITVHGVGYRFDLTDSD